MRHTCNLVVMSQAGLDLREVRATRAKTRRTALTALEPLVFPRIGTEIGLVSDIGCGWNAEPARDIPG